MCSSPPPLISLAREYVISAFVLQVLLCPKVPVDINFPCRVHTAFEMIFIDGTGFYTLYLYIFEEKWQYL